MTVRVYRCTPCEHTWLMSDEKRATIGRLDCPRCGEAYSGMALPTFPIALALLAYWERPWSSQAKRFAYHALNRALVRGIDVLEIPQS